MALNDNNVTTDAQQQLNQTEESDDEFIPLLRSGSSVLLPVRSLSPFRTNPNRIEEDDEEESDSSRCTTPELNPSDLIGSFTKVIDAEAEEDIELGKDLFKLRFQKSLVNALSSFTDSQDQSKSLTGLDKKAATLIDETKEEKKDEVEKPKAKKRQQTEAAVPAPKIIKTDLKPTSIVTRGAVAKDSETIPQSQYYNISQTKVHIFKAAEEGNLEVIKQLLQYSGSNVRHGRRNQTLLHVASAVGQTDVVLYLMNHICPNIINKDGQTAAHLAAMNGHTQVLKIILADTEFDAHIKDNWQRTFRDMLVSPLFEAALLGDKRRLRILLELGADPDYHAGKLVEGILSRELGVTTARKMAYSVYGNRFNKLFSKERKEYVNQLKVSFTRTPSKARRQNPSQAAAAPRLVLS